MSCPHRVRKVLQTFFEKTAKNSKNHENMLIFAYFWLEIGTKSNICSNKCTCTVNFQHFMCSFLVLHYLAIQQVPKYPQNYRKIKSMFTFKLIFSKKFQSNLILLILID